MAHQKTPRSSTWTTSKPRFLKPSHHERLWIGRIPDSYPDILRAPAVSYKPDRDDPRIKANKYVSFLRPYRGAQGLLLIGRDQRPILIDETQPDTPLVLPMRLDREAILGTWIFSVSIYEAEGLIHLEDCIAMNGTQLRSTTPFSDRYTHLQKFVDTAWYQDKQFQLNWDMRVVNTFPLESIRVAAAGLNGGHLCLMPNPPQFRLLRVVPLAPINREPAMQTGPRAFICKPVEGKPDVYDLLNEGTHGSDIVGRASIQTLSMSQTLQHLASTGQPIRVMAEWNTDFESYVVTTVL